MWIGVMVFVGVVMGVIVTVIMRVAGLVVEHGGLCRSRLPLP